LRRRSKSPPRIGEREVLLELQYFFVAVFRSILSPGMAASHAAFLQYAENFLENARLFLNG
jgi:hypothetical protein